MILIGFMSFRFSQQNQMTASSTVDQFTSKIKSSLAKSDYSNAGKLIKAGLYQHPGNSELLKLKKQWILDDYKVSYKNAKIKNVKEKYSTKYNLKKCQEGVLSEEALVAMKDILAYMRRVAGVNDSIFWNKEDNKAAQKTALMMDASSMLSHQPDRKFKCYSSAGAAAAANSNLSLGYGWDKALKGQMDDEGTSNYFCGHRRWILNPFNLRFAFGSTEDAMALKVFGDFANAKTNTYDSLPICWPAADYFPYDLSPKRWSFSLANADFSRASVRLSIKNKTVPIKLERNEIGYAINTIVWQIRGELQKSVVYDVVISNVKIGTGKKQQSKVFKYQLELLDTESL